jgi:hypothetical protein
MTATAKKTWKQLEAEGVKRCCVMFRDGTQCRRRVLPGTYDSWCLKHGPTMEAILKSARKMLENDR